MNVSWYFGWILIRWCWKMILIILRDQLYTVEYWLFSRNLALQSDLDLLIWILSIRISEKTDDWSDHVSNKFYFYLPNCMKNHMWSLYVRYIHSTSYVYLDNFFYIENFFIFQFSYYKRTIHATNMKVCILPSVQFLHSKFYSQDLWMMISHVSYYWI